MSFEVDFYRTRFILIFRLPKPEDFHIWKTVKCKTKKEAEGHILGDNGAAECVDAPYNPIKLYQVQKGKRTLVWSQGWDNAWGDPVVQPKDGMSTRHARRR